MALRTRLATAAMRKPSIANPYRGYVRLCGAITLAAVIGGTASILLPPTAMALALGLSIGAGSIALLTGLALWSLLREADRQIEAISAGECLAYWTYSPETWNRFAAQLRGQRSVPRLVPLSLFPTCGLSAGLTLTLLGHWAWLPALGMLGFVLAVIAWWCERRMRPERYPDVAGMAEVFISRGMLVTPANTFVWNRLAPQLEDVTIEDRNSGEPRLVFHMASQVKQGKIRSQLQLPIPSPSLDEAEFIVSAILVHEADSDDLDLSDEAVKS